jgi:hypothetical protein
VSEEIMVEPASHLLYPASPAGFRAQFDFSAKPTTFFVQDAAIQAVLNWEGAVTGRVAEELLLTEKCGAFKPSQNAENVQPICDARHRRTPDAGVFSGAADTREPGARKKVTGASSEILGFRRGGPVRMFAREGRHMTGRRGLRAALRVGQFRG